MDIAKIKNWKEHPKVLELKAKLETKKVAGFSALDL